MNLIFAMRYNYKSDFGGDVRQSELFARILRQMGHQVNFVTSIDQIDLWRKADMVFIWHLERMLESWNYFEYAKKLKLPIVLSPTYYPPLGQIYRTSMKRSAWEWSKNAIKITIKKAPPGCCRTLGHSWNTMRQIMLTQSDILLVNSQAEGEILVQEGASIDQIRIIPNVIDQAEISQINQLPWRERTSITCTGYFCPRKNQLGLIRALKNSEYQIIFVGTARPMYRRYYQRCVKESNGQHIFAGDLSHREVLNLLGTSRCQVCFSLSETPGISNLEAAALGAQLLLPPLKPIQEYFKNYFPYCENGDNLTERLSQVLNQKPSQAGINYILNTYNTTALYAVFGSINL